MHSLLLRHGRILGADGKPLPIAPELLARYDKLPQLRERQRRRVRSPLRC